MQSISNTRGQSGAVSLFVVIFAMLLISVVTVGFLRIMVNDQNKASGNDLAQSAYDSSQAGVEDAKRALLWYTQKCTGASPDVNCAAFVSNLNECNTSIRLSGAINAGDVAATNGGSGTGEIKVQQSTAVDVNGDSTDKALDQAYTCVKMQLDTDDYIGALTANQSVLVPLAASGAFSTLTVEWFSRDDTSAGSGVVDTPTPTPGGPQQLVSNWPGNRPSVMRTQFMQVGNNFTLADFDSTNPSTQSNANTVFLYPATNGFTTATMTDRDIRMDQAGVSVPAQISSSPLPSRCASNVSAGNYACRITLQLPTPVNGGNAATAYLRLSSLYNASHYRITLGGAQFRNVQPVVDATGRANDVFRRVQSRIDLYDTAFPYPDAALDSTGNVCKDFGVTDTQYMPGTCTP